MTGKSAIAERLGERSVLLPSLLGEALQANDRIKLRFSLLQEALAQARNPRENPPAFAAERQRAGLGEPLFDTTITGANALGKDKALVPGSAALIAGMRDDLRAMLAPIETVDPTEAKSFSGRLETLLASAPPSGSDAVVVSAIAAMTYHLNCSQSVGSRNLIVLLPGRFASATPQRRNSRQSNSGFPRLCTGVLMSPGEAP